MSGGPLKPELMALILDWVKEHDKERQSDTFIPTKGTLLVSGLPLTVETKHNIPKEYC